MMNNANTANDFAEESFMIYKAQILKQVESYVKAQMSRVEEESHGYRHVDRVRRWAIKIGKAEGGVDLFLLEIAALLHDIGRPDESVKVSHYEVGAKIAKKFLIGLNYFSKEDIEAICNGVYGHGPGGRKKLIKILQDADKLDALGAVGIIRAATYLHHKPHYLDKSSFKYKNWTHQLIKEKIKQKPWERSIINSLMLNLSYSRLFHTKTAKKLGREKYLYLKEFIAQYKKEAVNLVH